MVDYVESPFERIVSISFTPPNDPNIVAGFITNAFQAFINESFPENLTLSTLTNVIIGPIDMNKPFVTPAGNFTPAGTFPQSNTFADINSGVKRSKLIKDTLGYMVAVGVQYSNPFEGVVGGSYGMFFLLGKYAVDHPKLKKITLDWSQIVGVQGGPFTYKLPITIKTLNARDWSKPDSGLDGGPFPIFP